MTNILAFKNIEKYYKNHDGEKLTVIENSSFTLKKGEIVALTGPSGAGKSTLLHIAGILDTPSKGQVFINDIDTKNMKDKQRSRLRGKHIGFVYQFHHLLAEFNALENAAMPLLIQGENKNLALQKAETLLEKVGLAHRLTHKPSQLSGGEKQRVAIARALVNEPTLLLADEPTGNLDPKTAENVFALFLDIAADQGLTALIATHNLDLAARLEKRLSFHNQSIIWSE